MTVHSRTVTRSNETAGVLRRAEVLATSVDDSAVLVASDGESTFIALVRDWHGRPIRSMPLTPDEAEHIAVLLQREAKACRERIFQAQREQADRDW
jgi:hypothetical protein